MSSSFFRFQTSIEGSFMLLFNQRQNGKNRGKNACYFSCTINIQVLNIPYQVAKSCVLKFHKNDKTHWQLLSSPFEICNQQL